MAVSLTKDCDKERVLRYILQALNMRNLGELKRRLWYSSEDAPSGTAPTGMATGDFICHYVSEGVYDVYVYEGGTTYTNITG